MLDRLLSAVDGLWRFFDMGHLRRFQSELDRYHGNVDQLRELNKELNDRVRDLEGVLATRDHQVLELRDQIGRRDADNAGLSADRQTLESRLRDLEMDRGIVEQSRSLAAQAKKGVVDVISLTECGFLRIVDGLKELESRLTAFADAVDATPTTQNTDCDNNDEDEDEPGFDEHECYDCGESVFDCGCCEDDDDYDDEDDCHDCGKNPHG